MSNAVMLTDEDHRIFVRRTSVTVHARYIAADRRDAQMMRTLGQRRAVSGMFSCPNGHVYCGGMCRQEPSS